MVRFHLMLFFLLHIGELGRLVPPYFSLPNRSLRGEKRRNLKARNSVSY